MIVSKKILIAGLAIASLSLTGCSAIQDMLQGKVNDLNKNTKASEGSDALKKEVKLEDMKDTEFAKIFAKYGETPYEKEDNNFNTNTRKLNKGESLDKKDIFYVGTDVYERISYRENHRDFSEKVAEVDINDCPLNGDGMCGYSLIITSPDKEWNKKTGNQTFYIMVPGGASTSLYGPLMGDLQKLRDELKMIRSVKTEQ